METRNRSNSAAAIHTDHILHLTGCLPAGILERFFRYANTSAMAMLARSITTAVLVKRRAYCLSINEFRYAIKVGITDGIYYTIGGKDKEAITD